MEEITDVSLDWVQIKQSFMMLLAVFGFAALVYVHKIVHLIDLSEANKVTFCMNACFEDSTIFLL